SHPPSSSIPPFSFLLVNITMAGGIRFVMEGPNADLSQKKKRARLITACDACRTKKIKCVQPDVTIECEACRRSQTACLFGDRDRYHSERGISTALPHSPHANGQERGVRTSEWLSMPLVVW